MSQLTRAQKAAKAGIQHLLTQMLVCIRTNEETYPKERVLSGLSEIEEAIKEYSLDDNFLTDYVGKVYDALMKKSRYLDAAAIAKKYGFLITRIKIIIMERQFIPNK